jgi:hypothetical protein
MPLDLNTVDLPEVGVENFFNELENEIEEFVMNNGNGFYKLFQNHNGIFVKIEKTSEAIEENAAVDPTNNDRVISEDDNFNYMYVKFNV